MNDSSGNALMAILGIFFWLVLVVLSGLLYFLPSIVAFIRKQPNRFSIFVLNFLLGWSVIAWIISLMMALGDNSSRQGVQNTFYLSNFSPTRNITTNSNPPTQLDAESPPAIATNSPNRETSNILIVTVAACTTLALLVFGGGLFYYLYRNSGHQQIQQSSSAVRESPSAAPAVVQTTQPSQPPPPPPIVQPPPQVFHSLGTVTVFRQDSLTLNNPQKCHVRLRPNIASFVAGNSMSLGYIPCGQTVQVLSYDAPYYQVQANINSNNRIGWIYAGTTTSWTVPQTIQPRICQLIYPTFLQDSNGNPIQALSGNRYVILNDVTNSDQITVMDEKRRQIFVPRDACNYL